MKRSIILILTLAILLLVMYFLRSGSVKQQTPVANLPWQITPHPDGTTDVFGLTLGRSTLGEAETAFKTEAKLALFLFDDRVASLEAYFGRLRLGRISAALLAELELLDDEVEPLLDRATAREPAPSGARRVRLSPEDAQRARQRRIGRLSYVPAYIDLDEETLQLRFGEPAEIAPGPDGTQHWLYPGLGLVVVVNPSGSEMFHYCAPSRFDWLRQRLRETG